MKLAVITLVPTINKYDNVVSMFNPGIQTVLQRTNIRPHVFSLISLIPTLVNGKPTPEQLKVAATTAAYLLATYDGVIACGVDTKNAMRKAGEIYSHGDWTWIPNPDKLNPDTNREKFYEECAETIRSFSFRISAGYEQTKREEYTSLAKLFQFRRA